MTKTVKLYDAKTHLSTLVTEAAAGEEIIIAKGRKPMARLVPLAPPKRKPGGWETGLVIADDFDAPLPESVLAAFEGETP